MMHLPFVNLDLELGRSEFFFHISTLCYEHSTSTSVPCIFLNQIASREVEKSELFQTRTACRSDGRAGNIITLCICESADATISSSGTLQA